MNTKKLIILIISGLVIRLLLFTPELYHWDSGEYAYCIKTNHLPHDNYFGYIIFGKIISLFFNIDIALSLLSLISGLLSIPIFYQITKKLFNENIANLATIIYTFLPVNVIFSSFQEVHALQGFFSLLTILFLINKKKYSKILSGISFGFSFLVHNTSIMLLPFIVFLMINKKQKRRQILSFIVGAIITISIINIYVISLFNDKMSGIEYVTQFLVKKLIRLSSGGIIENNFAQDLFHLLNLQTIRLSYAYSFILTILFFSGLIIISKYKRNALKVYFLVLPYLALGLITGRLAGTGNLGSYVNVISPGMAITFSLILNKIKRKRKIMYLFILVLLITQINHILQSDLYSFNHESYKRFDYIKNVTENNSIIITGGNYWINLFYYERDVIFIVQKDGNASFRMFNDSIEWGTVYTWKRDMNEDDIIKLIENRSVYTTINNLDKYFNKLKIVLYSENSTEFSLYKLILKDNDTNI